MEFLGHVVSEEGLAMQPNKVKDIDEWKACQDVNEVRMFMGLSGYYNRFIKDFSTIVAPLYDLTHKERISVDGRVSSGLRRTEAH